VGVGGSTAAAAVETTVIVGVSGAFPTVEEGWQAVRTITNREISPHSKTVSLVLHTNEADNNNILVHWPDLEPVRPQDMSGKQDSC
jgi:hypothetical protein